MISLGIQDPTHRASVYRLAKVASAYGATFFVIGTADFPLPEEALLFDTIEEAQRSLVGKFISITPDAHQDVTEYLVPEDVVYVLEGPSEGLEAIRVSTPTGEALEGPVAAAVVLHDYTFAGSGAMQLAKALGLVS